MRDVVQMIIDVEKTELLQDLLKSKSNFKDFRKNYKNEQLSGHLKWRQKNESKMIAIIGGDPNILAAVKQMLQYMCQKYEGEGITRNFFRYAVPIVSTLVPLGILFTQMIYQISMNMMNTVLSISSFMRDNNSDIIPYLEHISSAWDIVTLSNEIVPELIAWTLVVVIVTLLIAICFDAKKHKDRIIRQRYYQQFLDIANGITLVE